MGNNSSVLPLHVGQLNLKLLDQLPFLMWISGTDSMFKWFNSSWLDFRGRIMDDEVGQGWIEGLHPEDSEKYLKIVLDDFKNRQKFEWEFRLKHHSDTYRWVRSIGQPYNDELGNFAGFIGTCTDITKSKEVESDFRENEERLKLAIESAVLGTWDFNPKTGELAWDNRCKELFGLAPIAKVDYSVFLSGLHDDDRHRVDQEVQKAFDPTSGGYYSIVYRTIGIDDKIERWLLAKGKAIFNESSEVVRFIGTILDITASKKAEIALIESEKYFRMMADNVPVAIWVTQPDGHCSYLNKKWYDYTGQTFEEALGLGWTKATHPDDQQRAGDIFMDCNAKQIPFQTIYRLRGIDGNYRWFLDAGQPKFNDLGVFEGYNGVVIDIHDRIIAENDLKHTNTQLVKINQDLDNFIYTASHDLKAPISNIEGLINVLKTELKTSSKMVSGEPEKILEMIEESIFRFRNTIQNLTEISKVQKGQEEDINDIDCHMIIEDVKLMIYNDIIISEAQIEIDVKQCNSLRFSHRNFTSIVYNLLSNAIKYRDPKRKLNILIKITKEENYTVMIVQDNGLGIPGTNLQKVFGMFKRFNVDTEGTGIGLYIVKRMVDNAGGKIEIESEVDRGTTFKVFFKN